MHIIPLLWYMPLMWQGAHWGNIKVLCCLSVVARTSVIHVTGVKNNWQPGGYRRMLSHAVFLLVVTEDALQNVNSLHTCALTM
jgi:hypothetical protein